jgi:hypothetical protein
MARREPSEVFKELCDISGKSMNEILPTEDELYRELRYTNPMAFSDVASMFGKMLLTKVMIMVGMSQCEAEQLASRTLIENSAMIADYKMEFDKL